MSGQVFVNRLLNLKKITHIGLDMDHTLIRYHTAKFEELTYKILLDKLVDQKNYPTKVLDLRFDFSLAIRGLVLDIKNGNILKLSRHAAIRQSTHGTKSIDFGEQKQFYYSKYIDLSDPNYRPVDTLFSIAFCVLYAQLIDLKEAHPSEFGSYEQIAKDLEGLLDSTHRDGSLKSVVVKNLEEYVIRDADVVRGLERLHQHGKKVFLVTNSDFYYTKILLDFALNPFVKDGKTWLDLFDYVITFAQKPRFFFDNLKYLRINTQTGAMTNHDGPLTPGVYQGGGALQFTADLKLNGDEILYIGDHIYGDVLRLKKDCNWRTALVIEDLEDELESLHKSQPIAKEINRLMHKKQPLGDRHLELSTQRVELETNEHEEELKKLQEQSTQIDHEIALLIQKQNTMYNSNWGQIFRTGNEESYFAYQVDRYACIYMSKLTDLLALSPRTYFRANRRPLAHEVGTE